MTCIRIRHSRCSLGGTNLPCVFGPLTVLASAVHEPNSTPSTMATHRSADTNFASTDGTSTTIANAAATAERKLNPFLHGLAGCVAGMASAAVFFPLDLVKTRQQATEGTRKLRMLATVRNTLATGGPSALYSGLSVNLYGSGFAWGLYFFGYNSLQAVLRRHHGDDKPLGSVDYFLAANVTGAIVCVVTNPIWVVKTRMQLQDRDRPRPSLNGGGKAAALRPPASSSTVAAAAAAAAGDVAPAPARAANPVLAGHHRYSSMWDGLHKLAVQEGLPGLSRGLVPNLLNVVHGSIHIASYERLRSFTLQLVAPAAQARRSALGGAVHRGTTDDGLTALQTMGCAAIAKTFALVTTYPLQVFRTRQHRVPESAPTTTAATEALAARTMNPGGVSGAGVGASGPAKASAVALETPRYQYEGILRLAKNIYRLEGVAGFYKGVLTASVREIPAACVTFLVYESVKQHLLAAS